MRPSTLASATARPIEVAPAAAASRGKLPTLLQRIALPGRIGLCIVVAYGLIAICAPVVAPHDPLQIFPGQLRKPPGAQFVMGTDEVGRDILSRIIFGSRTSLRVGPVAVVIAATIGTLLALSAGYSGGWLDTAIMRAVDVLLAFPGILLAIAIV